MPHQRRDATCTVPVMPNGRFELLVWGEDVEPTTGELLGVGDVLRPWEVEEGVPPVPFEVQWNVLSPVRMAVLDAAPAA